MWEGPTVDVPRTAGPLTSMQIAVATMGASDPGPHPTDAVSVAGVGQRLVAGLVDSLPVAGDGRCPRLTLPGCAPRRSTIAGRLWTRLSPRRPPPGMLVVVNAALVLLADHDLAASTFAVRVAASTRADPYAVVSAGLGALRGPLHGGASVLARALLDDAAEVGAARAVGAILRDGRRVPGFGHKVYTGADPRATVLLELLAEVPGARRAVQLADDVCRETAHHTGKAPNVDLALAALGAANGMAADAGEALMAVARVAGWLAHAAEEYQEAPLRFRPRARYLGA
jgi:citrate synthase